MALKAGLCPCTPQDKGHSASPPTLDQEDAIQTGARVCPQLGARCGHGRVPPSPRTETYLALLPVQVELVLADGHRPDGLDQRWARIPRVHRDAAVSERPPRHRSPGKQGSEGSAELVTNCNDQLSLRPRWLLNALTWRQQVGPRTRTHAHAHTHSRSLSRR